MKQDELISLVMIKCILTLINRLELKKMYAEGLTLAVNESTIDKNELISLNMNLWIQKLVIYHLHRRNGHGIRI